MWSPITDNAATIAALTTAILGAIGALWRWNLRPRRMIGWLSAVKERETLYAMWEQEARWRTYWEIQAKACYDQLTKADE